MPSSGAAAGLPALRRQPGCRGQHPGAGQVFVRYFRGANAHDVSGTELGLYLTRELARLQGGEADYRCGPTRAGELQHLAASPRLPAS